MSDPVRPHRRQPTRLPRPWDSPGKNTGVGCHCLLQCMKVKSESEVASVVSNSVRPHRWQPTRIPRPWDPPGKNTGVGCHFLLQCMKVKSESEITQSCPSPSDPMDCCPPGSSVHGIFQARVLEWGAHNTTSQNKTLRVGGRFDEIRFHRILKGFPCGSISKESTCSAGDLGSIPGLGRSPGEGNGNPLQYSCLKNPVNRRSLVGYSPRGCKESDMTE